MVHLNSAERPKLRAIGRKSHKTLPPRTPLKKAVIPVGGIIKSCISKSASSIHSRFTVRNYMQPWKKEFYPAVKLIIKTEVGGSKFTRQATFREWPKYPIGTWHKTCLCSFCRRAKCRLNIIESAGISRRFSGLKPAEKLKNVECGIMCYEALRWNRMGRRRLREKEYKFQCNDRPPHKNMYNRQCQ